MCLLKPKPNYWKYIIPGFVLGIIVALLALFNHREAVQEKTVNGLLYWVPRVLVIFFTLFVGMFALDVFGEGYDFSETIIAFLIHLLPVYIILLLLVITWKWEYFGGISFVLLGLFYMTWTGLSFPYYVYLLMSGIPILIGVLFILDRFNKTT